MSASNTPGTGEASAPGSELHFPTTAQLRKRATEKWRNYPAEVTPLFVAESDFATCPSIVQALHEAVDAECFGYPVTTCEETKQAFIEFCRSRYDFAVAPDSVFFLPDVVRCLSLSLQYLVKPGPYAFSPPAYPPFFFLRGNNSDTITVPSFALEDIEQAFKQGATAYVLCNPHNPTGTTFSREYLTALVELAHRYDARIISDEIHAPLTLVGRHIPAASVSPLAKDVVITAMAASKAWNVAGLKCAQLVVGNPADQHVLRSLPTTITDGVSTLGLVAARAAYQAPQSFLDAQIAYIRNMHERVERDLKQRFPGVVMPESNATYLKFVDFSEVDSPVAENPYEYFLARGIALSPGSAFGAEYGSWARINLACSEQTWEQVLAKLDV